MAKEKKKEKPVETPVETPAEEETAEVAETVEAADTANETAETNSEPTPTREEELEAQLAAEHDKYLRLAAEYDNFRKRSIKERDALRADIRSGAISELLPVYDNLSRALATECSDDAFYKGVEMTMTQLKSIFESMGVEEIPAVGESFDPSLHNAVMHIDDENYGEGIIVQEFQKGFKMGEKVIRFSMVQVAN